MAQRGVEDLEQFVHVGGQRNLRGLAGSAEALAKGVVVQGHD